jgi:allantoin racemase
MSKRIRVIVGSSVDVWDAGVADEMERFRAADTTIEVVHLASGPASIEDAVGEALATGPFLDQLRIAEADGCDGAIIYCFGDPGLRAARLLVGIPVVGLGEASHYLAAMLGHRFGIITAGPLEARTVRLLEENLVSAELAHKCVGVRSIGIPVLGLAEEGDDLAGALAQGQALVDLGADSLILGCGSILGLEEALTEQLHVPVVLPAAAALKMCELLLDLGLSNCQPGIHAAD